MAFSFYWSFIQLANSLPYPDLIESFSLLSKGNNLSECNNFHISDTLIVQAKIKDGNSYLLSFYHRNNITLTKSGNLEGHELKVEIPLYPPQFKAKQNYLALLQVHVNDYALPGIVISSTPKITFFSLNSTSTTITLEKAYEENTHELRLKARVLNELNLPIINRTVNFYLQLNSNSSLPNNGWIFLNALQTDANGTASLSMGCNLISGNHKIKAKTESDENFEGSQTEIHFSSQSRSPVISFMRTNLANETINVEAIITDQNQRPLYGKLFTMDFGDEDQEFVSAFTDETGHVEVSFPKPQESSEVIRLNYSIGADVFTSQLQGELTLNLTNPETLNTTQHQSLIPSTSHKKHFIGLSTSQDLNITLDAETLYATIPTRIKASYISQTLYDHLTFLFYLDETYELATVNVSEPKQIAEDSYLYEAMIVWCPDITGTHILSVIVEDSSYNFGVASTLAENSVGFMSNPAPSNMVVYHPQAVYSTSLRISVAFSGPRIYEPASSDLFYSVLLAPHVFIDSTEYVIDGGVGQVLVHFYVDGVHVSRQTNENGLAYVDWPFADSWEHRILNVTAVAESGLYEGKRVCQLFNLTKVHIQDSFFGEDDFMLDFSVSDSAGVRQYELLNRWWGIIKSPFGSLQPMYVGVESLVKVEAKLFDLSVWNAPVWVRAAWLFKFGTTDSNGHAYVPDDPLKIAGDPSGKSADYLHLASLYNLQYTDVAKADINRDGKLDMKDVGKAGKAFGSYGPNGPQNMDRGSLAHSRWCPLADIDGSNTIDMKDVGSIARQFGKDPYLLNADYANVSVHFPNFGNCVVDSQGFVRIPPGASEFTVLLNGQPIGAALDFGRLEFENYCVTNKAGLGEVSWVPSNFGFANYPETFYVIQAKLPPSFDCLVTDWAPLTEVVSSVNVFKYTRVTLRPTDIKLSHPPFNIVSVDLAPSDDAYVDASEPNNPHNGDRLEITCSNTIQRVSRTFLKFDLSFIPYGSSIWSASLRLYHGWSYGYECVPVCIDVGVVLEDFGREYWYENTITWNNAPRRFSSAVATRAYNNPGWHGDYGWWVFDLTETVYNWTNWYQANYGVVVKFREEVRYDIGPPYMDIIQFASKEYSDPNIRPYLHVEYIPEPTLVAECRDLGSGEPLAGVDVKFVVEGPGFKQEYSNTTNLEGVAFVKVWFGGHCLFKVTASTGDYRCVGPDEVLFGDDDWFGDSDVLFVDFRAPCMFLVWANGASVGNNSQVNVDVGYENEFRLELWPPQFWHEYQDILHYYPPSQPWFLVYVNGTYDDGLSWGATYGSFRWKANAMGVTFFRLESVFAVEAWATASFCFSVNAQAVPVALEFGVSP
ncbi:MAG: DNRLRE domain-containing protein, partial [Candidatus Bathyarchaeia archaeon]